MVEAPRAGILRLACWFGLLTGLLETSGRWVLYRYFEKMPLAALHPHVAWMTVTSDLAAYVALGAVLALVARWRPRLMPSGLASAGYAVLLLYCLSDIIFVESLLAWGVLALGVASAAARGRKLLYGLARRTVWPLAALAAAASVGVYGRAAWAEAKMNDALPPASAGAPNILLITLDTVRAQSLSLYGYRRPTTPRLQEFARRGVCFDRAIATVSWTLPSHASLFTGQYPQDVFHGLARTFNIAWEAPMDGTFPTLAEFLGSRGYRTGGFVANETFGDRVYGLNRGYNHYEEYRVTLPQVLKSSFLTRTLVEKIGTALDPRYQLARKSGLAVNADFLRWLNGVGDRPFFAFLNYMDAHEPYDPPAPYAARFSTASEPDAPAPTRSGPNSPKATKLRDEYDCCIAALDDSIGRLVNELDRRGLADHTVIVLTADHGEHFGEFDRFSHGDTLYMPVIHVPLIVVSPGKVPGGVRVRAPASLRDIAATIVDLAGQTDKSPFPGVSLRRFWSGAAPSNEPVYSNLDMVARLVESTRAIRLRSLVDDRYQYIEGVATRFRALYDLQRDPTEEHDLLTKEGSNPIMDRYHRYLVEHYPAR